MKAAEIRQRVEEVLRAQHLLLILDEADYIWPQSVRLKAYPERVNWLMTAAINQGVSVALIGSRNFSRMMEHVERRCPLWGSEQFHGRIKLRRTLPDSLDPDDLAAIAKLLLPESDEPARLMLVSHALRSQGYVAALESGASRAKYFAEQEGQVPSYGHIRRVMEEAGTLKAKPPAPPEPAPERGSPATRSRTLRVLPASDRRPLGTPVGVTDFTGTRPNGLLP